MDASNSQWLSPSTVAQELSEQPLLPPQASWIRRIVLNWTYRRESKILCHTISTIRMEIRQARPIGVARYRKVREIFLHDHSQRIVLHSSIWPIEIRVRDVISMETWWNAEDIIESLVSVSTSQIICATCEERFGDKKVAPHSLGSVAQGTVENWRI